MYEKGRYRFLETCSYSRGTVCFNSLEKLSLQWMQQGSPSEVLLWVLQENSFSVLKDEVLYIKEERVVKVSVDNVAVVGELNPITRRQTLECLCTFYKCIREWSNSVLCL